MSFSEFFRAFARIGLLSFGGPAAQIALMHRELVDERKWLTEAEFLRALSFCMMLPGPEAMQLATYAGWKLRGVVGGIIAGLLFVLPGAAVIAALALLYLSFGDQPLVRAAFVGVKAAVIAIVLEALLRISKRALKGRLHTVLAAAAFVALAMFHLPFPLVIVIAGLIGALAAPQTDAAALPAPAPGRALRVAAIAGALWAAPLLAAKATGATFLTEIGVFFSKLAVVTFGGAYAVLAYMAQDVVTGRGWLTPLQMVDALGLAGDQRIHQLIGDPQLQPVAEERRLHADAMAAVLRLLRVTGGPGPFHQHHMAGAMQGETQTPGAIGGDQQRTVAPLETIHLLLPLGRGQSTREQASLVELLS